MCSLVLTCWHQSTSSNNDNDNDDDEDDDNDDDTNNNASRQTVFALKVKFISLPQVEVMSQSDWPICRCR